jgi:hypothetical protein
MIFANLLTALLVAAVLAAGVIVLLALLEGRR